MAQGIYTFKKGCDVKRSKHSLSHYVLSTFEPGYLVPVGCFEVLPGDTVQQSTSALVRVAPLNTPVMHPVSVRIHHWFVPNRLLWANWENFITGGPDGMDASAVPYIASGGGGFAAGGLLDHLGVKPAVGSINVSALPVRAYNKIYNDNYRDEDLVTALAVPTTDGADSTSPVTLQRIAWEKDYFGAARPWAVKGPSVTLPLGTSAVVKTSSSDVLTGAQNQLQVRDTSGNQIGAQAGLNVNSASRVHTGGAGSAPGVGIYPSNLYADLSSATAIDVNTVRRAFALQRYEEARALYGSRYTEYLRYLGVRSSDARLQRAEYLGGGKQTISFSEVLQTAPTTGGSQVGVADLKGHGISAMRSRRYRRFFEEHGIVMSLMSVRPRVMYRDSVHKMWWRSVKEDYWQRELENIGQQAIQVRELYAGGGTGTFGYTDRYSEYRHLHSRVAGDFRSTLDAWHLAREFSGSPTLNQSFVECDPSTRIYSVTSGTHLWCMVSHSIQARRMVGKRGIGRVY